MKTRIMAVALVAVSLVEVRMAGSDGLEQLSSTQSIRNGVLQGKILKAEPPHTEMPSRRAAALPPGAVLIDFDDVFAPCSFSNTVHLTDAYAPQGILFDGPGGNDGGAILHECGNFGVSGHSFPNFLAFNANAILMDGGIAQDPETLHFDFPVSQVEIYAGAGFDGVGEQINLEAFDVANSLIDSDTITLSPTMSPLNVSGIGIVKAVVTSVASAFVLDDLSFVPAAMDPCADEDGDGRVAICHVPPGNPNNAHTITVNEDAVPAHLAHGDYCGPCEGGLSADIEAGMILGVQDEKDTRESVAPVLRERGP
ncbi:MAG: hypothetical protein IID34_09125 [Planctomycetes bacterium]|nr:hypothetical protein [Planctomycetota bacterium]